MAQPVQALLLQATEPCSLAHVKTTPDLARVHLGVVGGPEKILCCLLCPPHRLLTVNNAAIHLDGHKREHVDSDYEEEVVQRQKLRTKSSQGWARTIGSILKKHDVYNGLLSDIPLPTQPVPPRPYLKTSPGFKCRLCASTGHGNFFGRSERQRREHFQKFHPAEYADKSKGWKSCEVAVSVQSYSESTSQVRNFEVLPIEIVEDVDAPGQHEATAEQLIAAWRQASLPTAEPEGVRQVNLKTDAPFVVRSGWAERAASLDSIPGALTLVSEPTSEQTESRLWTSAKAIFNSDQQGLNSIHEGLRVRIMKDGSPEQPDPLVKLITPESVDRYGTCWARLLVFVVRLRQLEHKGTPFAGIFLTKNQQRWADEAAKYCDKKPGDSVRQVRTICLELSRYLWMDDDSDFSHMAKNSYTDVTTFFSLLINLHPDGSFDDPADVTTHLAPLKYAMHQELLAWILSYAEKKNKGLRWSENTAANALDKTRTSPFSTLCSVMTLAHKCAGAQSKLPNVIWQDEGKDLRVSVSGEHMMFTDFTNGVQDYVASVEEFFKKSLFFGMSDEEIGFDINESTHIPDDHSETKPGYSYLTNPDGPFHGMQDTLAAKFLSSGRAASLYERQVDQNGNNIWKPEGVARWLEHYETATRHLVILTHLLSGQPARGTELALAKLMNDLNRVRELYYMGKGRLAIVLFYNKTSGVTGKDRMVAHCVPWRITRLFFLLHGLVRPFALQLIHQNLGGEARRIQEVYAFALRGAMNSGRDISKDLRWFFRQYLNMDIGLRKYRHLAIAIMRKFLLEYVGPMERALAIVDAQAGHGSIIAGTHYAVEAAKVYEIDAETLNRFFLCSVSWYQLIMGKDSLSSTTQQAAAQIAAHVNQERIDLIQRPQHTVESCVAQMKDLMRSEQDAQFASLRAGLLDDYTAFFRATHVTGSPPCIEVTEYHRRLLAVFTRNLDATWTCPAQGEALAHILHGSTSVLAVLPTGAGKSLLFFGPAIVQNGISVVITPFTALIDNHLRTAEAKGIGALHWEDRAKADMNTRLIFVPVENAVQPSFLGWCTRMNGKKSLLRIYFDEIHEVLAAQSYRDDMMKLKHLVELDTPVIGLTATMPPELEPHLRRELGITNWVVIRERTQRKNLIYRTACFKNESAMYTSFRKHVETYRTQLLPKEGILIHCRSKEQVKRIAKDLGAVMYYSEYEHAAESARKWLNGEEQIIVTTSGLSVGVDHPYCRVTIHYEEDYGTLGYMQTTGRAGRDGRPALCLLFHLLKQRRPALPEIEALYKGWEPFAEMLLNRRCQRLTISSWLDGLNLRVSCASGDYAPCGWCADKRAELALDPNALVAAFSNQFQQPEELPQTPKLHSPADMIVPFIPRISEPADQSPSVMPAHQPQQAPPEFMPTDHIAPELTFTHRPTTPLPSIADDVGLDTIMQSPPAFSAHPPASSTFSPRINGLSSPRTQVLSKSSAQSHSGTTSQIPDEIGVLHHTSPHNANRIQGWGTLSSPAPSQSSSSRTGTTSQATHQNLDIQNLVQRSRKPKKKTGLIIQQSRSMQSASAAARTQAALGVPGSLTDLVRRLMDRFSRCCMICLIEKGIHQCASHTANVCPPVQPKGWTLPLHLIGDIGLGDAKSWLRVPPGEGLCYTCLFPEQMHETGYQRPNCKAHDVMYPLLWLILHDEQIRKAEFNGMDEPIDEARIRLYMTWLTEKVPGQFFDVLRPGQKPTPVLNVHTLAVRFMQKRNWLDLEEPRRYHKAPQPTMSLKLSR
ncbi:hypothetical protein FRC09_009579 [Ceratobasidium sp. 395]|nr:hypothetical protein FRC09_009579 [Ceratobasidium sp. 395]